MKLSLVVPCYNEEGNVEKFFSETNRVFENRVSDYEFVFVNDGSKDNTYKNLKHIYNDLNEKKIELYKSGIKVSFEKLTMKECEEELADLLEDKK